MSAFFHRAELIDREGPRLRYRYFPDFHVEPNLCGEFDLDIRDSSVRIAVATGWGPTKDNWDEISARRLASKVPAHVRATGLYPVTLWYIA